MSWVASAGEMAHWGYIRRSLHNYIWIYKLVWMWELDYKERWVLKNWCFWTVVLEMTLESPLECKEIQPVHPCGDQSWVFIGGNDAKAETSILWPPHVKSWLTGKDWCWEGLGTGGKGDDRGWDGWMASQTWWTWVWVNSGSRWWTGRPGVLWFMGSQSRTRLNNWTGLNWTELEGVLSPCYSNCGAGISGISSLGFKL